MDKETYTTLKTIVGYAYNTSGTTGPLENELNRVMGWIGEVAKEYYETTEV